MFPPGVAGSENASLANKNEGWNETVCNYFSCIFRPGGVINFTETNSHEGVILRLSLKDDSEFCRPFLRIECGEGDIVNFKIDESLDSLPSWYSENEQEYHDKLAKLLVRVNKIKTNRDQFNADCAAKCAALYADYEAKCAPLYADYEAKCAALYADCAAKRAPLYADYEAKCAALYADCAAKRAPLDKKLAHISGFVAKN